MSAELGTAEYFRAEVARLRQMWGEKKFWSDPERTQRAIGGLFYVWGKTEDATSSDETIMEATVAEFNRRSVHAAMQLIGGHQ